LLTERVPVGSLSEGVRKPLFPFLMGEGHPSLFSVVTILQRSVKRIEEKGSEEKGRFRREGKG